MRRLLLLCLLTGCSSLSTEDQNQLALYQQNASFYWEGGYLPQTAEMIERGLAISPDDYKLNTLKGMVLLRQAGAGAGNPQQEKLLEQAVTQFDKVFATRAPQKHDRRLLLGHGLALQALGMRHWAEAERIKTALANGTVDPAKAAAQEEQGKERRQLAVAALGKATASFEVLLAQGELVMLAHYHLMQVNAIQGQFADTYRHGDEYLAAAKLAREVASDRIQNTKSIAYERFERQELERVRKQELDVRVFLAEIHVDHKEYDQALAHLDAVLTADPSRSDNYYNRGQVLLALGRTELAKADFRKFLATSELPASSRKKTEAVKALGL